MHPHRPARSFLRLWPWFTGAIFAALSWQRLHDGDLFWHLSLGRAVLQARARTVPEPSALPDFGGACVVHEWLWDVVLFVVHRAWGWHGVSLLVLLVAFGVGVTTGRLATRWADDGAGSVGVVVGVTLVATPLVLTRVNERPESFAMFLWPAGLVLARAVARESRSARARLQAVALVLLALVWAQAHASVVAFVAAAAVVLLPALVGDRAPSHDRRVVGGAVAALSVVTLTTAHGLHIFAALATHGGGYVAEHVPEWMPLRWSMLDPSENVHGPAYVTMLAVATLLAWRHRRRYLVEFALAALGLVLVLKARRGVGPAGVLTMPLAVVAVRDAVHGVRGVRSKLVSGAAVAAGLVVLVRTFVWTSHDSPLGRIGLEAGAFPVSAAKLVAGAAGEPRVLTTYQSGPTIAFESPGHARTYVDSRTPLFFSASDLAAARATWSDPRALAVTAARFRFDLAVVERRLPVCFALASDPTWQPVLVEPGFTTFARTGSPAAARPLRSMRPCGPGYVDDKTCAADKATFDAEVDASRPLVGAAFADFLDACRRLQCRGAKQDGDAILALIPSRDQASGFEPARDATLALLLALAGRGDAALDLLARHVDRGDAWVLKESLGPLMQLPDALPRLRAMLDRIFAAEQDGTDEAFVVALANVCARLGDGPCARLHASRAAALGKASVAPALCWLAKNHDARGDAERWLEALRATVPPGQRSSLDCPR